MLNDSNKKYPNSQPGSPGAALTRA